MKINGKKIRKSFVHIFGGEILTEGFMVNNLRFIILFILMALVFISHSYTVISRIAQIETLENELKDAKYEALTISSQLTEASRQSQIERKVANAGLDLSVTKEPVYIIGGK